jgi:prolycopene isomerase
VEKIKVKDGAVKGIVTVEGEEIPIKYVVSNASKIRTFVDMVDPEDIPNQVIKDMKGLDIALSAFTIYIGCDCEAEEININGSTTFVLCHSELGDRLITQAGDPDHFFDNYLLTCYNKVHPGFSPPGTCLLSVVTGMTFDFWQKVPSTKYIDLKYQCADKFIDRVEKHFPNLRDHIEEIEVATPLTLMRYLGHPGGSFYGFKKNIKDSFYLLPENRTYIEGLYLSGASASGGGYLPTLNSGVMAAKELLAKPKNNEIGVS